MKVTFDIDANGILHVSAKDETTGKEQKIRIEASSGLTDAEIDKMVRDAEEHAKEDEDRKEKVEARNHLDSLVYQVEKDTAEWGDKVGEATKERLDESLEKAKEALKGDELASLNSTRDELMQAFSAAGTGDVTRPRAAEAGDDDEVPVDESEEGEADAEAETVESDEEVVEADYEIVDEGK